ncbi:hypothetical protein COOONC_23413 [Cooperia oncophora]
MHIGNLSRVYYFEKGWKTGESFRDSTKFSLFERGESAKAQLKDGSSGSKRATQNSWVKKKSRQLEVNDQVLPAGVEEDESLATRMLADDFSVNQSTIISRLKILGNGWKLVGWVSHKLSGNNKTERPAGIDAKVRQWEGKDY